MSHREMENTEDYQKHNADRHGGTIVRGATEVICQLY